MDFSSESHHAKSLESLGHSVIRLQEGQTGWEAITLAAAGADLMVWVHTHGWREPGEMTAFEGIDRLKAAHTPIITYHLDLWFGIDRQKDLERDPFYNLIDWFFATDKLMCEWFNENTDVKGYYLQAGVYDKECYMAEAVYDHDVIFVGSRGYHPEWQYRPQLIDWLKQAYGGRFSHYGGDGKGVVRGDELNMLYARSKVVVGDSLCLNFSYPHYWSDRVYETMGRGGFLIMPRIEGLEDFFTDRQHLALYDFGNFEELRITIDYYLETPHERERIRQAGHEEVKNKHTYKHRWAEILRVVNA